LLKDLMQIYNPNPVWIIKRALSDLKIIGFHACTTVTEPLNEKNSLLAEFISKYNID